MSYAAENSSVFTALYCKARSFDRMSSVRPSICPSVTLVDQQHIGWKSWKLIARTISPTPSLFVVQRSSTYSQGNMGNFEETRGGVGKSGELEHRNGNISETRKDRGKVTMEDYRNLPKLFRTVPSPTPYGLLFPMIGVRNPHIKLQSLLSREWVKLRTSDLAGTFTRSIRTKARLKFWRKGSVGVSRDCRFFGYLNYLKNE